MKQRLGLFMLVLLTSYGVPVSAQTLSDDLREMSIEDLMNARVISSTQTYVRLQEAPSSVFVVTGDQIRKWGIRRITELVERLVPGATSAEDLDDIIISFRGITSSANLQFLLLLNGHEYNTQWNSGPSSEVELGLIDDIKKVEVLIGPHNALYGSGALIGVINMITKTGRDFNGVRVSANYGSGNYRRGDLLVAGEPSEDFHYLISAGGLAADGYDNNGGQLNISQFPASWRFFSNIYYKSFEIQSRYTRSSRTLYVTPVGGTRPDPWTNYDTFFAEGKRSFQANPNLRLDLNLSFDTIQTHRRDFRTDVKMRAVGEDRYTAKATAFYSGWSRHNFVLGSSYRRDQFGSDWEGDNYNFGPVIVGGEVTNLPSDFFAFRNFTPYGRNVYALFGQDHVRLHDKVSLLLGFRYDRVEAPKIVEPNLFSPRLALVYTPTPKFVFKTIVSSGVSRTINAANTSPDPIDRGFATILDIQDPEKMHSFEIAGSYRPNPALDISLNVFYNSLRNIFGVDPARPSGNPPTPEKPTFLISAGRIDYVGFEAVLSAKLGEDTFFRALHQNVQLGSVVQDPFKLLTTPGVDHLNNYPENMTKLVIDHHLNRSLSFNLNGNLVWNNYGFIRDPNVHFTSRVNSKTVDSGFYGLLNANVVWNLHPNTELVFSGYNLLNTRKQISPFHFNPGRVFVAERNFNVNLSHNF